MNSTTVEAGYGPAYEGTSKKTLASGAILEGVGGIAVIALAIIGLAGIFTGPITAIASIVLGASVLAEGGAFAASRWQRASGAGNTRIFQWGQGLSVEVLGALAGIILGILALLGVAPAMLVSVAALVFGATFACSGAMHLDGGTRMMCGLAGFVLGLLAVCGLSSVALVLVAWLCLGASTLFTGAETGTEMATAPSQ